MASGVQITTETTSMIEKMKVTPSGESRMRLLTFTLGEKTIDPCQSFTDCDLTGQDVFEKVISFLEDGTCLYILYDCCFHNSVSDKRELVLLMWCSQAAKVRDKMRFASSLNVLKKAINGVKHIFEVDCLEDLCSRRDFAGKLGSDVCSVEGVCI